MTKVLILGVPNDYHISAVTWGVERLGGAVYVWMPGDLPDLTSATISIDAENGGSKVDVQHDGHKLCISDFDVIWNRRRESPRAPRHASPFDAVPIETGCLEHVRNMLAVLASSVPMINDPASQHAAGRKAAQLITAKSAGLSIPPTVISNSADDIRHFIAEHGRCIGKPYFGFNWITSDSTYSQFTFALDDLPVELSESAGLCPIIVQKRIHRKSEVRVIYFNGTLTAVKVADAVDGSTIDSRILGRTNRDRFAIMDVPVSVEQACVRYIEALNLSYGAFDFIIDGDNVWYFLECNESGQFLYLEEMVAETQLLYRFCRWLVSFGDGAQNVNAIPDGHEITLQAFEASEQFRQVALADSKHNRRLGHDQFVRESFA